MSSDTKTIMLPSGRSAEMREAKVRDLLQAHRTTGFSSEPMVIASALIAEVIVLDGKRVVYEDVMELSAEDGLVLQSAVMEGGRTENFQAAPGVGESGS
jgi:hypothetical protein